MTDKGLLAADIEREGEVRVGSDRAFGLTIGIVLAAVGAGSYLLGGSHGAWWLGAGAGFALAGLVQPRLLGPLNRAWFRFGLLLHRIVSPVVLGLMFFAVIAPIGLLMRLLGKRPLNLRFDRDAPTYWVHRDPPGPAADSFKDQF